MLISSKKLSLITLVAIASHSHATDIFKDDFQDGDSAGWSMSGNGTNQVTVYSGNYSLRLTRQKQAQQAIATTGYENVSVSMEMAASSLEGSDQCLGEVSTNGGSTWTNVVQVVNGQDDGVTMYSGSSSSSAYDDISNLTLRVRSASNLNSDYCWADNIAVTGDVISGGGGGGDPTVYDSHTGDGSVSRSNVTYSQLMGTSYSLTNFSAFAVPANAANPTNTFSGLLEFVNESSTGSFSEQGTNLAGSYTDPGHLPEFSFEYTQLGTHIIPAQRGLISTSHPSWSYILEPGRVWQENSDSGYSRVAMPFSLQENGANCTHNGVMTFLFKDDGSISNVAYQIASETCAYFKYNMWGMMDATYSAYAIAGNQTITDDYQAEVAARMPTKPISELATDYPSAGLTIATIGSEQSSAHRSAFGVAVNNVHYVGGCETRYGTHPFCEALALPSYSTAKSVVGGIGLMRLEQKYAGNQKDLIVSDWVNQCSGTQWQDVTLEDALDMATGNYDSAGNQVDEGSTAMLNGFFLKYTDSEKASFSCSYTRKATPGSTWVYRTTDTYILGAAIDGYFRNQEGSSKDFYTDMLVEELWKPLDLSPTTYTSLRTFDTAAQVYSGYGLTFHTDDVIKLAEFLNNDSGQINSVQMVDSTMLADALQQTANRGLEAGGSTAKYQNSFWAWNAKTTLGCANDTWIPYMSGYGGIGVVLLPGGINYYFFSDNAEYTFSNTIAELHKISSFCQ